MIAIVVVVVVVVVVFGLVWVVCLFVFETEGQLSQHQNELKPRICVLIAIVRSLDICLSMLFNCLNSNFDKRLTLKLFRSSWHVWINFSANYQFWNYRKDITLFISITFFSEIAGIMQNIPSFKLNVKNILQNTVIPTKHCYGYE